MQANQIAALRFSHDITSHCEATSYKVSCANQPECSSNILSSCYVATCILAREPRNASNATRPFLAWGLGPNCHTPWVQYFSHQKRWLYYPEHSNHIWTISGAHEYTSGTAVFLFCTCVDKCSLGGNTLFMMDNMTQYDRTGFINTLLESGVLK